jgi:hypothetical protein
MIMRRAYAVLLVLALVGTGASLAALGMPIVRTTLRAVPGLRHLAGLNLLCPGTVVAGETLKFRPLPAESARAMARRRARAAASVTPPPPAVSETPEAPEAPSPPETPRIVKSGDVMRVGSDIHVGREEVVTGSVSAIGGDVTVDGHVEGDVSAIRGDVYLSPTARVDGDVVSAGGQIHEEPGAYVGGQRVTAMPGSKVKRLQRYLEHDTHEHVGHVAASLVWFLVLLGVSWAIVQLAPARTAAAVDTLRRTTIPSIGIGALILALIIPSVVALSLLVAFLCITIIGIPLALAALLAYGLFFATFGVWGFVVGAGALGGVFLQRRAGASAAPVTISRAVMTGVILLAGTHFVGSLFGMPGMFVLFRVLGGFLFVITIIMMALSSLAGGGAWVRSEFQTGRFGRWWHGRKASSAPTSPSATSAPPPPPPPPAPPSPPSAFAPPAADPGTAPPTG